MGMRTKKEMIDSLNVKEGEDIKSINLRIDLCRLEVEIDIRDLLESIAIELSVLNSGKK